MTPVPPNVLTPTCDGEMDAVTCVQVGSGVKCFGSNKFGDLGNGSYGGTSNRPVQVVGLSSGVVKLTPNGRCVVINQGVKCWGGTGNVNFTASTSSSTPTPVDRFAPGTADDVFESGYSNCAILNSGVTCLGGTLWPKSGVANPWGVPWLTLPQGSGVTGGAVTAYYDTGYKYTVCIIQNGGLACRGDNSAGQFGNGTFTSSIEQLVTTMPAGSGITSLVGIGGSFCAIINGGVKCWGDNSRLLLGNQVNSKLSTPYEVFPAGSGVTSLVATGLYPAYCAAINGGVKCWGEQYWNISGGTFVGGPVTMIPSGSGYTRVYGFSTNACAQSAAGVKCWGRNACGQLGTGNFNASSTPVDVAF